MGDWRPSSEAVMSYRIRPDSPVRKNVRRLARRELDRSLAALADPGELGLEETVHDVRKRCKKVRGVLRLARPGLGREYSRANAGVRDAARELSGLRDAHATLATFDELVAATRGDAADGGALARVRRGLAARAGAGGDADAQRALARAAERLAEVRRRVPRWSPDDDVAVLLGGLEANYARARRAFHASLDHPADEALHEWRKRVKYGWHHAKLMHPVAPSALGPMAKRLKDLSDGLGDDHDLAVLRALIVAAPRDFGGAASTKAVALIDGARGDLQDRCLRLGARIYAEPAPAFRKRLGGYWAAWQTLGRERPAGEIGELASEPADRPPHAADLLSAAAR
jgi:CHAD domain-containing protein